MSINGIYNTRTALCIHRETPLVSTLYTRPNSSRCSNSRDAWGPSGRQSCLPLSFRPWTPGNPPVDHESSFPSPSSRRTASLPRLFASWFSPNDALPLAFPLSFGLASLGPSRALGSRSWQTARNQRSQLPPTRTTRSTDSCNTMSCTLYWFEASASCAILRISSSSSMMVWGSFEEVCGRKNKTLKRELGKWVTLLIIVSLVCSTFDGVIK